MRGTRPLSSTTAAAELIPENYFETLDFAQIFGRTAPVEIDIGCGDGAFLVQIAEQNPQRNFLGIERLRGRVDRACHKIARQELANARVLRLESSYVIARLLPPGSVVAFHLLFPDPWPKRRHQSRRVVDALFVDSIHRALCDEGLWRIVTDQADYFAEIQRRALTSGKFAERDDCHGQIFPASSFEEHFRGRNAPVFEMILRKI